MGEFLLTLLVSCVGVSLALKSWDLPKTDLLSFVNKVLDQEWMLFKKNYNRTYTDANEEVRRRLYWEDTIRYIQEHNLKYDRGESTFTLGENDFADMAEDEFEEIYLRGLIIPEGEEGKYPEGLTEPDPEAPLEMDWRPKGLVSPVKNQGRCGSCWAFSALGSLEGQEKKKHGKLKDLSEQNLVDCANSKWGCYGCRGGWMNRAFKYISHNRGLDSEKCYPYVARDEKCKYHGGRCNVAKDKGYKKVGRSIYSLQITVAGVGPIAIAADISNKAFWYYKAGVYDNYYCHGEKPNHAMLAVGYESNFWIIKNSWGIEWGKNGYVDMAKNWRDRCGVAKWASYPDVR